MKGSPCLVTVHGIGFEQPPTESPARAGYADARHSHLRPCLLCRVPAATWRRDDGGARSALAHFVAAGRPIRKYVRIFDWGDLAGLTARTALGLESTRRRRSRPPPEDEPDCSPLD